MAKKRKNKSKAPKGTKAKRSISKAPKGAKATKNRRGRAAKAKRASSKAAKSRKSPAGRAKTARVAKKAAKKPATTRKAPAKASPATAGRAKKDTAPARRAPTLDRERRTVIEDEPYPSPPSTLDPNRRGSSAARTGRAELAEKFREHTSTSPAMTGGDIDADWEDAESVGEEAPGGDNPTPDQDVVDEIGKALGVEYEDNEELQGGDEIRARDRHRWELDPASREETDEE